MAEGTPDPSALVGTVLAGRYEVTGVLGAGGMGVVLEARQIAVDRKVAVKVLHPHFGANRHAASRFVREMQVTSRLEHASTVRVYDFGEAALEGAASGAMHLFLVMELVQGTTLGKVLARGPLGTARTLAIALQIARALEAAHGEGIVHRDLKPDNVMLVDRYGAVDQVKVLDFGIARFVEGAEGEGLGKLTAEGAVVGTPAYMSPEQATGSAIGPSTDLYSFGVMLFEMATGTVPFTAPTTVSLMVKHVQELPPRPSSIVAVPAGLEALILALLEKDPAARPASARELAERLEALQRELDPGARPPAAGAAPVSLAKARGRPDGRDLGSLAADTAKTPDAQAADTNKRVASSELPPRRARSALWLVLALVLGAGAVVALVVAGAGGGAGTPDIVEARPLDVFSDPLLAGDVAPGAPASDASATASDVNATESDTHATVSVEPPVPAGCDAATARAAVEAARVASVEARRDKGDAAAAACPTWAVAQVHKGVAYQQLGDYDAARAAFREAITLAPGWGVARFDLALVEAAAGRYGDARAALAALFERAPAWPNARALSAQVELGLGDYEAARRAAEAAVGANPERPEAWFLLGEAHRALGAKGSAEVATKAYCKAKALGMEAAAARCP